MQTDGALPFDRISSLGEPEVSLTLPESGMGILSFNISNIPHVSGYSPHARREWAR